MRLNLLIKLFRGEYTLIDGLEQVSRYAQRLGLTQGYLIIFDPQAQIPWSKRGALENIEQDGIHILVVRV